MTVSLEQLNRCHFAVDLGAARTRVYVKGVGLVVDEPSAAAVNTRTGALIAVGELAEKMTGRTPGHIRVVRPVSGGCVVDIDMAQRMLRHLIGDKLRRTLRRKPRLRAAVCTPHDMDPLARRAMIETLVGLGARRVECVDTLVAAAVGCGLPVEQPEATMVIVSGTATTQIAVLSMGSIVTAIRVPVGGDAIDHAVIQHLRQQHALMLPSQTVRPLQVTLSGNGLTTQGPDRTEVHGRDATTGRARSVQVETAAVRDAIHAPLTTVLDGISKVLRDCPPDLVADLAERGIMMVGGSARLPGLDAMLSEATGMPVRAAERPDVCAVQGLGAMMEGRIHPMVLDPSAGPSPVPSVAPPAVPPMDPSAVPPMDPSAGPSPAPSAVPPVDAPGGPSPAPSTGAFGGLSASPSVGSSTGPSVPSAGPSGAPSPGPSAAPPMGSSSAPSTGAFGAPSPGQSGAPSPGQFGAASPGQFGAASTGQSGAASTGPSATPSTGPSATPSTGPAAAPSASPFGASSTGPSAPAPTGPSAGPSAGPSGAPSSGQFGAASTGPSATPTTGPSTGSSAAPSAAGPSGAPWAGPSAAPTSPSTGPSAAPSTGPSPAPSADPSSNPSSDRSSG